MSGSEQQQVLLLKAALIKAQRRVVELEEASHAQKLAVASAEQQRSAPPLPLATSPQSAAAQPRGWLPWGSKAGDGSRPSAADEQITALQDDLMQKITLIERLHAQVGRLEARCQELTATHKAAVSEAQQLKSELEHSRAATQAAEQTVTELRAELNGRDGALASVARRVVDAAEAAAAAAEESSTAAASEARSTAAAQRAESRSLVNAAAASAAVASSRAASLLSLIASFHMRRDGAGGHVAYHPSQLSCSGHGLGPAASPCPWGVRGVVGRVAGIASCTAALRVGGLSAALSEAIGLHFLDLVRVVGVAARLRTLNDRPIVAPTGPNGSRGVEEGGRASVDGYRKWLSKPPSLSAVTRCEGLLSKGGWAQLLSGTVGALTASVAQEVECCRALYRFQPRFRGTGGGDAPAPLDSPTGGSRSGRDAGGGKGTAVVKDGEVALDDALQPHCVVAAHTTSAARQLLAGLLSAVDGGGEGTDVRVAAAAAVVDWLKWTSTSFSASPTPTLGSTVPSSHSPYSGASRDDPPLSFNVPALGVSSLLILCTASVVAACRAVQLLHSNTPPPSASTHPQPPPSTTQDAQSHPPSAPPHAPSSLPASSALAEAAASAADMAITSAAMLGHVAAAVRYMGLHSLVDDVASAVDVCVDASLRLQTRGNDTHTEASGAGAAVRDGSHSPHPLPDNGGGPSGGVGGFADDDDPVFGTDVNGAGAGGDPVGGGGEGVDVTTAADDGRVAALVGDVPSWLSPSTPRGLALTTTAAASVKHAFYTRSALRGREGGVEGKAFLEDMKATVLAWRLFRAALRKATTTGGGGSGGGSGGGGSGGVAGACPAAVTAGEGADGEGRCRALSCGHCGGAAGGAWGALVALIGPQVLPSSQGRGHSAAFDPTTPATAGGVDDLSACRPPSGVVGDFVATSLESAFGIPPPSAAAAAAHVLAAVHSRGGGHARRSHPFPPSDDVGASEAGREGGRALSLPPNDAVFDPISLLSSSGEAASVTTNMHAPSQRVADLVADTLRDHEHASVAAAGAGVGGRGGDGGGGGRVRDPLKDALVEDAIAPWRGAASELAHKYLAAEACANAMATAAAAHAAQDARRG